LEFWSPTRHLQPSAQHVWSHPSWNFGKRNTIIRIESTAAFNSSFESSGSRNTIIRIESLDYPASLVNMPIDENTIIRIESRDYKRS